MPRNEYTKAGWENQIEYSDSIRERRVQNAIGVGDKKQSDVTESAALDRC
jgi:hypothetical protein